MVNRYTAICIACDRLRFGSEGGRCDTFSHGIPDDIAYGMFDHREPHVGDNGVQFKLRAGFEKELQWYEASKSDFERNQREGVRQRRTAFKVIDGGRSD
jgi:hypothetical protein